MPVQDPFLPRVIVKFRDSVTLPWTDDIGSLVDADGIGPWNALEHQFPGIRIRRLSDAIDPVTVSTLVARAVENDPTYNKDRKLLNYFIIDCPPAVYPEQVAEALNADIWRGVEAAYVAVQPQSPAVAVCSTGYRDKPDTVAATGGIDAVSVVGVTGADGTGVALVDLELGWNVQHEALTHLQPVPTLLPGAGAIDPSEIPHGTMALGIVCGQSARLTGIAPASQVSLASYFNGAKRDETLIPVGITKALGVLKFGDVLLLEVESPFQLPIETRGLSRDYIRLATAVGVVVVEPAGNAGIDLDAYVDPITGALALDPNFDSGAIVVAAGSHDQQAAYVPLAGAGVRYWGNYGTRINCWAWGDASAFTSISIGAGDTTRYNCFDHTSAASAIVAGAAVAVQGMFAAVPPTGRRFSPMQLRGILSQHGTPCTGPNAISFGRMPDLFEIASQVLNVIEDVYMRDFVGDTGEPNTGAFCRSPDVIVQQTQVANPQASFGAGSGTENDDTLSEPAIAGQDNYVYVRLLNRGGRDAANVQVDLYVAPPASLILASDWQHVGSTVLPNVPAGDVLTVSDPIVLAAGAIAATGHYCFVAIAGNASDPAPPTAEFAAWDRYERFIAANNNVVWRNFDLVSPDAPIGSSGDAVEMDFDLVGAPDRARPMTLEVVAQLPMRSLIALETSMNVLDAWGFHPPIVQPADEDGGRIYINAHGAFTAPEITLRAGAHVPVRLSVTIPDQFRQNAYEVYARQLYEGREVGRITWRLQRPPRRSLLSNVVRRIASIWRS